MGEETRIVYGAECMRDQLLGCEFDISPTAFYQTNPQQTELLYRLAIDGMDCSRVIFLWSLLRQRNHRLCAVKDAQDKGIGIMLLGVERNPAALPTHVAMPSSTASPAALGLWPTTPPITSWTPPTTTSGSMSFPSTRRAPAPPPEFLEAACALKPRRITYISCNPVTQERDLHQLLDGGYRLLKITPVDMFPHTDHTETVAVLERR